MNHDHKSLLDRRREGQEFSLADINRALQDAGDLALDRSKGVDTPIPDESEPAWKPSGKALVEPNESGHRETAWQGYSKYLDYRN